MNELMKLPMQPENWIVDGLLRAGRLRPSLLAGKPEAGKSTLAWQLAVAVTKGAPFLGRNTTKGKVIFWQTEEESGDLRDIGHRLGYSPADAPLLVFVGDSEDNNVATLHARLMEHPDTKLVIIETLDDLLKFQDIKENTAARKAFDEFHRVVVDKFSASVVFLALHHIKKREVEFAGDGLLGASVIRGRTDAKIYIAQASEDDQRRIIHATVRKGVGIPRTYLEFDEATQTATLGETVADQRHNERNAADRQLDADILAFFACNPGTPMGDVVHGHVVAGKAAKKQARFNELVAQGLLRRNGSGRKGDPYTATLAEVAQEFEVEAQII